ncbi:hypothetical protein B0T22DRAFT_447914 [Podospora appendiculata]|uniref:Uncharacterized protein n=1 Tax=Podospora appendiculata TaxID=314037 RepID=A0AAE0XFV5_9PEZI|nr:hypothetical protein B0T22DRAFT_447914 [Podospora appendiculata]
MPQTGRKAQWLLFGLISYREFTSPSRSHTNGSCFLQGTSGLVAAPVGTTPLSIYFSRYPQNLPLNSQFEFKKKEIQSKSTFHSQTKDKCTWNTNLPISNDEHVCLRTSPESVSQPLSTHQYTAFQGSAESSKPRMSSYDHPNCTDWTPIPSEGSRPASRETTQPPPGFSLPASSPSGPSYSGFWLSSTARAMESMATYLPPPSKICPRSTGGRDNVRTSPCRIKSDVGEHNEYNGTCADSSTSEATLAPSPQQQRDSERWVWLRTLIRTMIERKLPMHPSSELGDIETDLRLYKMGMLNDDDLFRLYGMGPSALQSICRTRVPVSIALLNCILDVRAFEDMPERTRRGFEWQVSGLRDAAEKYDEQPSPAYSCRLVSALEALRQWLLKTFGYGFSG